MIGCHLQFGVRLLRSGEVPAINGPDRNTVDLNVLDRSETAQRAARSSQ